MQGLKEYTIPFDLEEEESQYWLGYLCADGNVQYSKEHRVYKVSLASKDKEIIDKFICFMGNRAKYHFQKQNNVHIGYVSSIQLCEYLISLGITPKKALTLDINIPLTRHFVRGYFDGDGSIRNRDYGECKITCGSLKFVTRLCSLLDSLSIYYKVRVKGNAYDISIERKKECKAFLDFIYKNSSIYLQRKYLKYVALFGNK